MRFDTYVNGQKTLCNNRLTYNEICSFLCSNYKEVRYITHRGCAHERDGSMADQFNPFSCANFSFNGNRIYYPCRTCNIEVNSLYFCGMDIHITVDENGKSTLHDHTNGKCRGYCPYRIDDVEIAEMYNFLISASEQGIG